MTETAALEKTAPAMLSGVPEGAEAYMLARQVEAGARALLYVARDDARMTRVKEGLRYFLPAAEVLSFPAWDCLPYDRVSPNPAVISQRVETLVRLSALSQRERGGVSRGEGEAGRGVKSLHPNPLPEGEGISFPRIVVTTVNALLQRLPARARLAESVFFLQVGERLDREALTAFLVKNGYTRVGKVMEHGEFAVRGGIIDLFAPGSKEAFRLDLFGDDLESIRCFEPLTQVSEGKRDRVELLPVGEVFLDAASIERFRTGYRERFGAVTKDDPLYESISQGRKYPGMEHWMPLFHDRLETLADYVPGAAVVLDYLSEEARDERLETIRDYYDTRKSAETAKSGGGAIYHPLPPHELYLDAPAWEALFAERRAYQLSPFVEEGAEPEIRPARNFSTERKQQGVNLYEAFKTVAAEKQKAGKKVLVACFSIGSRDRFQTMLADHGVHAMLVDAWKDCDKVSGKTVGLLAAPLEQGFETKELALFSEQDILGERIIRRAKKKRPADLFMMENASFLEGELVVHADHGIGRFEGLESVQAGGGMHDCLKILYQGGDKLFVPVENIDVLSRYGSEDEEVKLDKLGGVAWQEKKAKLKERIKMAADELLKVAAERAVKSGAVFHAPEGMYEEFCARFPYAETEDQERAIAETLEDLQSGQPMDRLVCGDVGFGKTEVALRAAFIAAQPDAHGEKKQVAVVVPTTLLARQHTKNFKQRFEGFPIRIRQLSRMVSAKEAAETRKLMEEGGVDIVIGTHALLAKNVKFKSLGLVIVDEEQHFGVQQKERLKQLKADVHVLTLSATPIPRTLQMALTGVRSLSLITTPPVDRLAVRTFVMPYDPVVIREAILREHYRSGQVFYVTPRIKDLDELVPALKQLVPEVKLAVAHGQMPPQQLDTIMNDFYDGKYDVLLSTSIVESGLDVPTANTLIIHRADMFGLAQLYQLRGRVGRGKIRAYAYLTLPWRRQPSKMAIKRLEVMQTLDTLGAGFSVASHDMDIRGFGNLLGEEQSGHIREVGVELYQQMLEEAVAAARRAAPQPSGAKGGEGEGVSVVEEEFSPQITIGLDVRIPETYVEDLTLRLGLYRRLASLHADADIESLAAELVDRFGALPAEVQNLLAVLRIKLSCRKAGIERIDAGPKGAVVTFRRNTVRNPEKLLEYIMKNPKAAKLRPDQKLVLMQDWEKPAVRLKGVAHHAALLAAM